MSTGQICSCHRYFGWGRHPIFTAVKFLAILFLLVPPLVTSAQEADTLASRELEGVVVTGQFEPQSAGRSVYRVRTIPLETLRSRGAVKLQDVLNTELNIRFNQDAALGGSNITMQGLSGQNVKVLIDGLPMVGRQGTSNEININQININTIERVEIVEGPMSVAYGADALAGVINIITKKPEGAGLEGSFILHEETAGDEYGTDRGIHNQALSLSYGREAFTLGGNLTHNFFGGWTGDSTSREKTFHPKKQWLAGAVAGYTWESTKLHYRLDFLDEEIYNPANFMGAEALDQYYYTRRFMHQLQGEHTFSSQSRMNVMMSYSDYTRETQTVTVDEATGDIRLALGPGLQDETRFRAATLRSTWYKSLGKKFGLQSGLDLNYESGSGERLQDGSQNIGDYALFVSAEWQITPALQVRPGLRAIHNTVYAAPPAVPSLNVRWTLNENQQIRLAYGRGFRAPSLRELYFDFVDANHTIQGNTDLLAELSHSVNGSWSVNIPTGESMKLTSELAGFYNHIDNMISFGVDPSNPLVTTYINIDTYKTTGGTWTGHYRTPRFDASVGFGYTGRFNQFSESQPQTESFTWSPELSASASYQFPKQGLTLTLFSKYTGSLPYYTLDPSTGVPQLAKVAGYTWADATVRKEFKKGLSLSVGVRNLLNVSRLATTGGASGGAHTGGGAQLVGYGRSYFLELSYSFSKHKN